MEEVGFWCLLFLACTSAAPSAPRVSQEERSDQNTTLEADHKDQVNLFIEVRGNAIHRSLLFVKVSGFIVEWFVYATHDTLWNFNNCSILPTFLCSALIMACVSSFLF